MTKLLKNTAIVLLLIILSSIALACTPNKDVQKPSVSGKDNVTTDMKSINFENQVVYSQIVDGFDGNIIIHSYSELEKFFTDHCVSEYNHVIFNKFNVDYFNDKALVFCYFWATDARIKRQVENIYIVGNTLQIEVMNIFPYTLTEMDEVCFFIFNILQVNKSDITNITDIIVSFRDIE
ncbi:MAG: hypothetical protein K2O04_05390 [Clostridiales bacterium]|nr:hypothetical protein [Clostridiales bacterium]